MYMYILFLLTLFSLFLALSVVSRIYVFMDKNVVSLFFKFVSWFDRLLNVLVEWLGMKI